MDEHSIQTALLFIVTLLLAFNILQQQRSSRLIQKEGTAEKLVESKSHASSKAPEKVKPAQRTGGMCPVGAGGKSSGYRGAEASSEYCPPELMLSMEQRRNVRGRRWGGASKVSRIEDLLVPQDLTKFGPDDRTRTIARIMGAITRAHGLRVNNESRNIVFDIVLDEVLQLSNSEYGFIGEWHQAPEVERPHLHTYSITNIAWTKELNAFYREHMESGLYFYDLNNLFGHCLIYGMPIISNSPAEHELSGGLPVGHPPLNAVMLLPFKDNAGQVYGCIGIANRPGGYNEDVRDFLSPYITTIAQLLRSYRQDRKAEESRKAMDRQSERLNAVIEAASSGIWEIDMEDNNKFYASAATYRTLSMDVHQNSEFRGLSMFEACAVDAKEIEALRAFFGECGKFNDDPLTNTRPRWNEHIIRMSNAKTGAEQHILVRANTIVTKDPKVRISRIAGSIDDITQKLEMEQAVIRASNAKSEFLANMSHEMRTPLNAMLAGCDIIDSNSSSNEVHDIVNLMRVSANHLTNLVNDVLDFSSVESGRIKFDWGPVDVQQLLAAALDIVRPQVRDSVNLDIVLTTPVNKVIHLPHTRVLQVLINVLNNAAKFTHSGNISLIVDGAPELIEGLELSEEHPEVILFSVKDSGIGIPQEKLNAIFQPFTQLDMSSQKKYRGAGVGLAVCKKILNTMGGDIRVSSAQGVGSTFYCYCPCKFLGEDKLVRGSISMIPRVTAQYESDCLANIRRMSYEADSETQSTSNSIPNSSSNSKAYSSTEETDGDSGYCDDFYTADVLVAEDNKINQKVITKLLDSAGITSYKCSNGSEAVKAVQARVNNPFKAIFMDINMPVMDGIESTRIIMSQWDTWTGDRSVSRPKIVAFTASAYREDEAKCREMGMTAFLPKPVRKEDVLAVLHQLNLTATGPRLSFAETADMNST
eukprot:Clim_evm32s243 gene=Clim_evmTU32s243